MNNIILFFALISIVKCREFQFQNNLSEEIWVGCLGNTNTEKNIVYPALNGGGWKLSPGQSMSVQAQDDWAGRFWGRTGCDSTTNHCATGDCGNKLQCNGAGGNPPASLVEITLKGDQGLDYYDVSLVDGFNIDISIEPEGGQGDGGEYSCKKSSCTYNFLSDCPSELQYKVNGEVVGCNSACNAFHTDEYCCTGAHSTAETCQSSDWPKNYPEYFKSHCPLAYSYAYDDHKSIFTCKDTPTYLITFGG